MKNPLANFCASMYNSLKCVENRRNLTCHREKTFIRYLLLDQALLLLVRRVSLIIQEHRLVKRLETLGMKLY
jgi:hypothetical protein